MAGPGLSVVVIDAPSNLGLSPPAEGKEPGVRVAGTWHRVPARRGGWRGSGVAPVLARDRAGEPGTGTRNGEAIIRFALDLAGRVGEVVESGRFPLVLGGDCSILIGGMLALRWMGRFGLVFVDGHLDFRQPGGMDYDELVALLGELFRSELAVGMEVTIFDPDLDPTGEIVESFCGK